MKNHETKMTSMETAFVGRIAARVSHEFMNVLAVVRESSGLIQDLAALEGSSFPHREKMTKALDNIQNQVLRGMQIGRHLNRFAHSLDEAQARVEVNDLLDRLAFLLHRSFHQKRIQMKVRHLEPPLDITTDPFRLQMILAEGIEYCLGRTAEGGQLTLRATISGPQIVFLCLGKPCSLPSPAPESVASHDGLNAAAEALNGCIKYIQSDDRIGYELILPFTS